MSKSTANLQLTPLAPNSAAAKAPAKKVAAKKAAAKPAAKKTAAKKTVTAGAKKPAAKKTVAVCRPSLSVEERLELFDQATQRQREREARRLPEPAVEDRGWTREELYDRGLSH
jgi:hypothetical protein